MGIYRLRMQRDSRLIIKQVNGEVSLTKNFLVSYRTVIQKLIISFSHFQYEHVSRAYNKHTDTLATLASKIDVPEVQLC